jgi:hypothetical protein
MSGYMFKPKYSQEELLEVEAKELARQIIIRDLNGRAGTQFS